MRCPNCFCETEEFVCARCGFDISEYEHNFTALPLFTELNNKYIIGRVLGQGGFGVTYKAISKEDGKYYAIKEYLPSEFSLRMSDGITVEPSNQKFESVYRHGRNSFLEEARMLYKFRNNPIVVDIYDYFEENNTAYFSMEFLDGMNLKTLVNNMGGKISINDAKTMFVTIASGLVEIHKQDVLHRDISPENIFLTTDNKVYLIDFGAARDYIKSQNSGFSILLKPGFAPPEQYKSNSNQGPWTDVYALAMTFYAIVTGKKPVDAMERYQGGYLPPLIECCEDITETTSNVIEKATQLDIQNRYRSFEPLLNDIDIEYNLEKELNKSFDDDYFEDNDVVTKQKRDFEADTAQAASSLRDVISKWFQKKHPFAVVSTKKTNGASIKLNGKFVTVGRSEKCNIVVDDAMITREHCLIRFDSKTNQFIVIDKSRNGTFSENGRLERGVEYRFNSGEKIFLSNQDNSILFILN